MSKAKRKKPTTTRNPNDFRGANAARENQALEDAEAALGAAEDLARTIEATYQLEPGSLVRRGRNKAFRLARTLAYHGLRQAGYSLPAIGGAFGRDHTCVLRALRDRPNMNRCAEELAIVLAVDGRRAALAAIGAAVAAVPAAGSTGKSAAKPLRPVASEREKFGAAVAALRAMPAEHREAAWASYCRDNYRYSTSAQAAQLPHGC